MSKKFVRNVMKLLPGYIRVGNIFYLGHVADVLFGFAYERSSGGVQCYLYIFPLFIRSEFLHLGHSVRIPYPNGFIPITSALEKKYLGIERKYSSLDDEQVASEFVRICQDFSDISFRYKANLDGFVQRILDQSRNDYNGPLPPLMIDNSERLYLLAAAFALKSDADIALADLEMLFDKYTFDKRADRQTRAYAISNEGGMKLIHLHDKGAVNQSQEDQLLSEARQLYALLRENSGAAIEWLKEIEKTIKEMFKLK